MTFLSPFFLYFLILAAVPPLLSLFLHLNQKKEEFPAVEFLSEILSGEISRLRVRFRLRAILRAMVILLTVFALSRPVFAPQDQTAYTLIIDDSLSMSRFNFDEIFPVLRKNFQIHEIYFGTQRLSDYEGFSENNFNCRCNDFFESFESVKLSSENSNFILISDGQISNFSESPKSAGGNLKMVLLRDESQNDFLEEFSFFPAVSRKNNRVDFSLSLGSENARVTVTLAGEEIFEGSGDAEFSRFIEFDGISFGKAEIFGDDFSPDNVFFFSIISSGKPSIYNSMDSLTLKRTLSAVFGSFQNASTQEDADFIFTDSLSSDDSQLAVLFSDSPSDFEDQYRALFGKNPLSSEVQVSGETKSERSVFESLRLPLLTLSYEDIEGEVLLSGNGVPVASVKENTCFVNFSLSENETALSSSLLLLFLLNEVVVDSYEASYFLSDAELLAAEFFYDENAVLLEKEEVIRCAGIYREKESGKTLIVNPDAGESIFEFYGEKELSRILPDESEILPFAELSGEQRSPALPLILMSAALFLFLFEGLFFDR